MADLATLGLAVDSSQVDSAAASLDKFSASADQAATSAEGVGDGMSKSSVGTKTAETSAQKMINTLSLQQKQITMGARDFTIFNDIQKAGVSASSAAGQQIAKQAGILFDLQHAGENAGESLMSQRVKWRSMAAAVGEMDPALGRVVQQMGHMSIGSQHLTVALIAELVVLGAVAAAITKALTAYIELEAQQAKFSAALLVTGGASGMTVASLETLAQDLAKSGTQSVAEIRLVENELLKFHLVSAEVFPDVMKMAQGLAATGFTDMKTAALALAKAITDPTKMLAEFEAVGLHLSGSQAVIMQRQAIDLRASGNLIGSRTVVLNAASIALKANAAAEDTVEAAWGRFKTSSVTMLESWGKLIAEGVHLKAALDGIGSAMDHFGGGATFLGVAAAGLIATMAIFTPILATITAILVAAGAIAAMVVGPALTRPQITINARPPSQDALDADRARRIKEATDAMTDQSRVAGLSTIAQEAYNRAKEKGLELDKSAIGVIQAEVASIAARNAVRSVVDQTKSQAASLMIEANAYDMTTGKAFAYKIVQEAIADGIIHDRPLSARQKADLQELADAYGKVAQAAALMKINKDIAFDRQTSFLTSEDVAIAQKLKGSYPDVATAMNSVQAAGMRMNNAMSQVSQSISSGLSTALLDIAMHTKTAGEAFKAFGLVVITAIQKMIIELLIVGPLMRALQGGFGGIFGGGIGTATPDNPFPNYGIKGTNFLGGGMVDIDGTPRYVHPAYFENAPRMALGGMIDWAAGERPIIGHVGERMLNRKETAAYNSGSGYTFATNINIVGSDITKAQVAEVVAQSHKKLAAELPDRVAAINRDPRKRG